MMKTSEQLKQEIEECKQAEQLLKQREAMLQHIADNLPVMFTYVDTNERYLFVNKNFEINFKQSNVIGKTIREVVGQDRYKEIKPGIDAVLDGKTIDFESNGLFEKGDQRYFRRSYRPEIDESGNVKGIFALIYDITEIKLVEKALKESEEKFRSLFDLSPLTIALTEMETGKFVDVNDKLCELSKYAKEEIIGRTATGLGFYSEQERGKFIERLNVSREVNGLEMDFKIKDGSIIETLMFARQIQLGGERFILTALYDMTERNRLASFIHLISQVSNSLAISASICLQISPEKSLTFYALKYIQ